MVVVIAVLLNSVRVDMPLRVVCWSEADVIPEAVIAKDEVGEALLLEGRPVALYS
jgi:hypothetical protein